MGSGVFALHYVGPTCSSFYCQLYLLTLKYGIVNSESFSVLYLALTETFNIPRFKFHVDHLFHSLPMTNRIIGFYNLQGLSALCL